MTVSSNHTFSTPMLVGDKKQNQNAKTGEAKHSFARQSLKLVSYQLKQENNNTRTNPSPDCLVTTTASDTASMVVGDVPLKPLPNPIQPFWSPEQQYVNFEYAPPLPYRDLSLDPIDPIPLRMFHEALHHINNQPDAYPASIQPASTPASERAKKSCAQPFKVMYRRTKKIKVRMPWSKRVGSNTGTAQTNTTAPQSLESGLVAIGYDQMEEGTPPLMVTHRKYPPVTDPPTRINPRDEQQKVSVWPSVVPLSNLSLGIGIAPNCPKPSDEIRRTISAASTVVDDPRKESAGSAQVSDDLAISVIPNPHKTSPGMPDTPSVSATSTVVAEPPKESGDGIELADMRTHFRSTEAPVHRSRAASIKTTSSFGCIDGLPSEQRELQRQRKRGVKGTIKKFAKKAFSSK